MKKHLFCTVVAVVCLLILGGAAQAQEAQGVDLTNALAVAQLHPCGSGLGSAIGKSTIQPFRPAPSPDDPDSGCWGYSNGNYSFGAICSFSPNSCLNNCLNQQESCVDACYSTCGNADNTNGSCFESCGDTCRDKYNACANKC